MVVSRCFWYGHPFPPVYGSILHIMLIKQSSCLYSPSPRYCWSFTPTPETINVLLTLLFGSLIRPCKRLVNISTVLLFKALDNLESMHKLRYGTEALGPILGSRVFASGRWFRTWYGEANPTQNTLVCSSSPAQKRFLLEFVEERGSFIFWIMYQLQRRKISWGEES